MPTVRVATSQYTVGDDIAANLAKILEMADRAADGGARLVAVPEFANHTCIYRDAQHAWDVAVDPESDFVRTICAKAAERTIYIVFNSTRRGETFPTIYDTNFLVGPDGVIVGMNDKAVLIGVEHVYITPAPQAGGVFDTEIGRIGLYSCMDGVLPEVPRLLALQGAQLLVNTLNSMANDEPGMHIPVRAAENGVWVLASNKVGPIVTAEAEAGIVARIGLDAHILQCLGEVQIVAPDGSIAAEAAVAVEDLVFADIDVAQADDKRWDDGDLFADRRPDTYGLVAQAVLPDLESPAAPPFEAAVVQVRSDRPFEVNVYRALDLAADAARTGARLVVLPELFPFTSGEIRTNPASVARRSAEVLERLQALAAELHVWLATSLLSDAGGLAHTGWLVAEDGSIAGSYRQVHLVDSMKPWAAAGDRYHVWETPLGRIGMMIGYDAVFPEVATVLARMGADVIVHPTSWRLGWEVPYGMPERAAENRVSIVSAARWDSPARRGGMILPAAASRSLSQGDLSPVWPVEAMRDREGYVRQVLDPAQSRRKLLGADHVLAGRRTDLYAPLTATPVPVAAVRR